MDPLSQAVLGASLSQSLAKAKQQKSALLIGALAGMAPDLDVLIQSKTDPLLFLEFHRQFTHSLAFIPVGALICALVFFFWIRWFRKGSGLSFRQIYLFSFAGFATHGLLDACTSYGTQLLWPFSNARIAWNVVSIVDPLFTLPVLLLVVLAAFKQRVWLARAAFAYAVLYLAAGYFPRQQALEMLNELALVRLHQPERVRVKPSFGNRRVWKLMYEYDGRYYVDAVKLSGKPRYFFGTSIQKLDTKRDFPWLPADSQQAEDIKRFSWFSDGYLALSTQEPYMIVDIRYSFLPDRIEPMWGIKLDRRAIEAGDAAKHADFVIIRKADSNTRKRLMEMVF